MPLPERKAFFVERLSNPTSFMLPNISFSL